MATTRDEIHGWLKRAQKAGATHMLVVCDSFDHDDYPVEVMPGEDARKKFSEYNAMSMQRVMEIYNLSVDLEAQLLEPRSFNF